MPPHPCDSTGTIAQPFALDFPIVTHVRLDSLLLAVSLLLCMLWGFRGSHLYARLRRRLHRHLTRDGRALGQRLESLRVRL